MEIGIFITASMIMCSTMLTTKMTCDNIWNAIYATGLYVALIPALLLFLLGIIILLKEYFSKKA